MEDGRTLAASAHTLGVPQHRGPMSEAMAAAATNAANGAALTEVLIQQLKVMLEAGNYDGVKLLLQPVQEVDIAEAIGGLPRTLQALAFRLLSKDEAIEVYEYLEPSVQQTLLERLRSSEVLELVEEMSPDDRVHLFDELPAKVVRRLLAELSPAERRVTAQLLGYEPETAGRLMTTEFIDLKELHSVAQALAIVRRRPRDTATIYSPYVTDASPTLTGTPFTHRICVRLRTPTRFFLKPTRQPLLEPIADLLERIARALGFFLQLVAPAAAAPQEFLAHAGPGQR